MIFFRVNRLQVTVYDRRPGAIEYAFRDAVRESRRREGIVYADGYAAKKSLRRSKET